MVEIKLVTPSISYNKAFFLKRELYELLKKEGVECEPRVISTEDGHEFLKYNKRQP